MTESVDSVTQEILSALSDLQRAILKIEEEETCGAGIWIGIAVGKLESLVSRRRALHGTTEIFSGKHPTL